ncbi:MAG: hypothetical protein MUP90_17730 [Gammaproteobacteria bacterium]|nr:hypothetical protein [Gammaproteobacteria bacterium]
MFEVPGGPADGPCVLTLAIPDILGYQSGTAVGPGSQMLVSFDGGLKFVADRASHKQDQVTDQSGVARVTHLRWLFGRPLQPGVRGYVRYRAIKLAPPVEASEQSGVTPVDGNISQEKNP